MIYVIGAGYMAREYARVLKAMGENFLVIGRGKLAINKIQKDLDVEAFSGGVTEFISNATDVPDRAIVCTPVETLFSVTIELINFGVKNILVEKPGALSVQELIELKRLAHIKKSTVMIGYNRRFYQATLALQKRLDKEELIAANFEMTEWANIVENESCTNAVKEKWVISNTSHVIDLVMHIAGSFEQLSSYTSGSMSWHKHSSRFVGSGVSNKGILLSYCGYWDGPGRWSAEFITKSNRYIFRPMEKLAVQKIGEINHFEVEGIDYSLDEEFKPGIYMQVSSFISKDFSRLCNIDEQIEAVKIYDKIANY